MNMADVTQTAWYTALMRYAPRRSAVSPGNDPYSSAMERTIGSTTPALRAPFEGIIPASTMSDAASEYATPSEVWPKARTKNNAMRRAKPVLISAREMKNATSTSHTDEFE